MPKFPSFKPRGIEKILRRNGFVLQRQTGSHRIFHNRKLDKVTVVPFHSRDIARGTVRSIIRQSGLDENKFVKK